MIVATGGIEIVRVSRTESPILTLVQADCCALDVWQRGRFTLA